MTPLDPKVGDTLVDNDARIWKDAKTPREGEVVDVAGLPDSIKVRWPSGKTLDIMTKRVRLDVVGEPRRKTGYTLVPAKKEDVCYVGIVETNDAEGEEFGYYWPFSDEAERALRKIVELYESVFDDSDECPYRLETPIRSELKTLDEHDGNGYMPRVQLASDPEGGWAGLVEKVRLHVGDHNGHEDPFYKGNLLDLRRLEP